MTDADPGGTSGRTRSDFPPALSRALEVLRGVAEREACGDLVRTLLPLSVSGGAAGMRARGDFADRGVDRALRGVGTTTSMCGRARRAASAQQKSTGDGWFHANWIKFVDTIDRGARSQLTATVYVTGEAAAPQLSSPLL